MIIDTHAHLNMEPFVNEDVFKYIEQAKNADVQKIINVGVDFETSLKAVDMLNLYEGFYATIGVHPYDAGSFDTNVYNNFLELVKENKNRVVAVGECGLDYFRNLTPVDVQKDVFKKHIKFAEKVNLPMVIHTRDAEDDTIQIFDYFNIKVPLVVHCFTGSLKFAKQLWGRGCYTSFTGIITFKNASDLREVVKNVPLDKFMVETDCPYLAPQNYRGKTNEPAYVVEVIKQIADIKGMSYDEVVSISTKNAENFYGL